MNDAFSKQSIKHCRKRYCGSLLVSSPIAASTAIREPRYSLATVRIFASPLTTVMQSSMNDSHCSMLVGRRPPVATSVFPRNTSGDRLICTSSTFLNLPASSRSLSLAVRRDLSQAESVGGIGRKLSKSSSVCLRTSISDLTVNSSFCSIACADSRMGFQFSIVDILLAVRVSACS